MVNSRCPALTSLPSWKWRLSRIPAARARTSATLEASRRPGSSVVSGTTPGCTVMTPTSGAGGAPVAAACFLSPQAVRTATTPSSVASVDARRLVRGKRDWEDWRVVVMVSVFRSNRNKPARLIFAALPASNGTGPATASTSSPAAGRKTCRRKQHAILCDAPRPMQTGKPKWKITPRIQSFDLIMEKKTPPFPREPAAHMHQTIGSKTSG